MQVRGGLALVAIACACGLGGGPRLVSACTTIAVGRNASADGSTMTTHNADVSTQPFNGFRLIQAAVELLHINSMFRIRETDYVLFSSHLFSHQRLKNTVFVLFVFLPQLLFPRGFFFQIGFR